MNFYYSTFFPRDGRTLVAGGKSNFLHMWNLETKSILRVIELPSKVTLVKQLEFLPESFDAGSNQASTNLSHCVFRYISQGAA